MYLAYKDQSEGSFSSNGDSERELACLQARVFLEDALHFRSIFHKVHEKALHIYMLYYGNWIRQSRLFLLVSLQLLVFFEYPSSLSITPDVSAGYLRYEFSCGVIEAIEFLFLSLLCVDISIKVYVYGVRNILKTPWILGEIAILFISFIDWSVSVALCRQYEYRIRRYFRPYFIIQDSSLAKKIMKSIKKTIPEVLSLVVLLFLLICIFATILLAICVDYSSEEKNCPFRDFYDTFYQVVVLLTTANHPDVMVKLYGRSRFYPILFIVFLLITLCLTMNVLIVLIYNHIRDYLKSSMRSALFRRNLALRACYEVLIGHNLRSSVRATQKESVDLTLLTSVINSSNLNVQIKEQVCQKLRQNEIFVMRWMEFQNLFRNFDGRFVKVPPPIVFFTNKWCYYLQRFFLSRAFEFISLSAITLNFIVVIVMASFPSINFMTDRKYPVIDSIIVLYYVIEAGFRVWSVGWRRFFYYFWNLVDTVLITIMLVLIITAGALGDKSPSKIIFFVLRVCMMLRTVRAVFYFQSMRIILITLEDVVYNIPPLLCVFYCAYHVFALLGMSLMQNVTKDKLFVLNETNWECGTYSQMEYWPNNFDDYWASLVVLWDLMIVNNWYVIVDGYSKALGTKWIHIYFYVWWLLCAVVLYNVLVAFVIDVHLYRRERYSNSESIAKASDSSLSFHRLFFAGADSELYSEEDVLPKLLTHSALINCIPHVQFRRYRYDD